MIKIEEKDYSNLVLLLPLLTGIETKVYLYLFLKDSSTVDEITRGISSNRKSVSNAIDKLLYHDIVIEHYDTVNRYEAVWVKTSHIDQLYNTSYDSKKNKRVGRNGKKIPTEQENWALTLCERFFNETVKYKGTPAHMKRIGGKEKLLKLWAVSVCELVNLHNLTEDEVEGMFDWLINQNTFWIRRGAIRSPSKLVEKSTKGDKQYYYEIIQEQMKNNYNFNYNKTKDERYRDPYNT